MAKKQIVVVDPPKVEVCMSDIKKLNEAISELSDVRVLLDNINDCNDDLKTIGFIAGRAYAIIYRVEDLLLDIMGDINGDSDNDDF